MAVCSYATYIHSITISLHPKDNLEQVSQLVPLRPHFTKLYSFSFWFGQGGHANKFVRPILVQLVEALPPSCVNLELDTSGNDARVEGDQTHLCDSFRDVLPRMQHVRLRVRSCEALFTDPSTPDQTIGLPHLKSFIYTCSRPPGKPLPTCHHPGRFYITHNNPNMLWTTVTSNLQRLISTPNAVPTDAQVHAFITTARQDHGLSLWQAHICADMHTQTSLVLPHRAVWIEGQIRGSYMLRLLDGSEVMSEPATIEAIAEGQLWREARGGTRLPAPVLTDALAGKPSFAVGCVEKPLAYVKIGTQWRKDNPTKKLRVWVAEEREGRRLVNAKVRKGKDEYLSLERVMEIRSEDWGLDDELGEIGA